MDGALQLSERGELAAGSRWTRPLTNRAYLGLVGAFTALGLVMMALESFTMNTPAAIAWMESQPTAYLVVLLVSLVASIVGIVLQCVGRNRKGRLSIGLVMGGYGLLVVSLGFCIACGLVGYDVGSITSAFVSAAALSVAMTCLGFAFPGFFQRIFGILFALLIGVIIAEVALLLLGMSMGWLDWVVLAVFSGFMGYDTYRAANDAPCVANAVIWASSIYVDFVNIFLSLLQIMNRD